MCLPGEILWGAGELETEGTRKRAVMYELNHKKSAEAIVPEERKKGNREGPNGNEV